MKLSKPSMNEMTAKSLGDIAEIFLEDKLVPEYKIQRFKIDFFSQKYKIAYEYDGPEHIVK
jgi:very-short-patch-repair endonuclease